MKINGKLDILYIIRILIAGMAFIVLCIPCFNMTGIVAKPLLMAFAGSVAVCAALLPFKKFAETVAVSQLIVVVFWFLYAIVKQIALQIEAGWTRTWIEFFYFDKFLIVGTVWLSTTLFVLVWRMIKSDSVNTKIFFRLSSFAFVIFYAFLLVYSFVLIRLQQGTYPMNFVPFTTIREYYVDFQSIPYEVFMMFFGNLFYFTPLGYIFYVFLREKKNCIKISVFVLFPLAAFFMLEFSQYLFQNGFCEIDDIMMNAFGFWLGAGVGKPLDLLVRKLTKNRIQYLWG